MKVNSDSISAVPVMVMLSLAVTRSTIGAVLTFAMWAAFLLSTAGSPMSNFLKFVGGFAIVLVLVLSFRSTPQRPVIAVDTVEDAAYAKSTCAFQNQVKGFSPCLDDGHYQDIEHDFRDAVLENPACADVGFSAHDFNILSAAKNAHTYVVYFQFAVDSENVSFSEKDSYWRFYNATYGIYATGEVGNMYETAGKVCRIAKGEGGRIQ